MTQNIEVKNVKKKKVASLEKKKARAGWIFVLPFVIGLIFIYIPIIVDSLTTSMVFTTRDQATGLMTSEFKAWESYYKAFTATVSGRGDFVEVLI